MKSQALILSVALLIPCLPARAQVATPETPATGNVQRMLAPTVAMSGGLAEARENLMAMFLPTDTASFAQRQQAIKVASARVDAGLDHANTRLLEIGAKLKEFGTIWAEFKNSRDNQLIPLLAAGNRDAALRIAEEVQAERLKKMREILENLALSF